MAILTYRTVKESSLTYDELDDNFKYFKENPEINSVKISVLDNLNDIDNLPVGSITGGLNWNIDANEADPDESGFRLFVKTSEDLWDPIVTQQTVVNVNTATYNAKGVLKIGPTLSIDTTGELNHLNEPGMFHVPPTHFDSNTHTFRNEWNAETEDYIINDMVLYNNNYYHCISVEAAVEGDPEDQIYYVPIGDLPYIEGSVSVYWALANTNSGKYLKSGSSEGLFEWAAADALPSRIASTTETLADGTATSGKFLTNDGDDALWGAVDALPSRIASTTETTTDGTATSGKFLTNDGTNASWAFPPEGPVPGTTGTGAGNASIIGWFPGITAVSSTGVIYYTHTNILPTDCEHSVGGVPTSNDNSRKIPTTSWVISKLSSYKTTVDINTTLNGYSPSNHVHSGYSPSNHVHSGYLSTSGNGSVSGTITATDFIINSDRRLKSNIKNIEKTTTPLLKVINPVTFNDNDIGFIAQDFEEYAPELVSTKDDGYLALKYSKITALLWKQNQELLKRIETLEKKL